MMKSSGEMQLINKRIRAYRTFEAAITTKQETIPHFLLLLNHSCISWETSGEVATLGADQRERGLLGCLPLCQTDRSEISENT